MLYKISIYDKKKKIKKLKKTVKKNSTKLIK